MNNPALYDNHRTTIGRGFMKKLYNLDDHALRNGYDRRFKVGEAWTDIGSFNQEKISPSVIKYFVDVGYIITYTDYKISITNLGIQIVRTNPEHESLTVPSQYTDHIS
jgi:hypothetical protein